MYNQPLVQQVLPVVKPHKGLAISALTLGVIAVVFGFIPLTCWIAIPCGLLAIIFGVLGRAWGMGKTGLITGSIGFALGIWGAIIVATAVNDVSNNLNDYNNCIQNSQTLEQMGKC